MIGIDSPRLFIEVEGIQTAYYRQMPSSGTTAPRTVVLLHGGAPGACSDLNWFRNFDVLAKAGYDVIAYDQPGFGHSAVPTDPTIEFRYRHAASFLEALSIDSAHLIGNSIGGLISTLLSHRLTGSDQPRIRSLILAAPFPYFAVPESAKSRLQQHRSRLGAIEPNFDSIQALCLNTFSQPELVTDEIVELRLSMLQGDRWTAYKERAAVSREFNSADIQDEMLHVPTLMIWGLGDRSLPCEIGIEAFNYFDNARFLFLPHCGHWPQTEQADIFNHAVIEFLRAQPS